MCRAAAIASLALGGCAHSPAPLVAHIGTMPAGPALTYDFGPLDKRHEGRLQPPIAACLETRGTASAENPAYLVQLSLADEPAVSGVYLPDVPTSADTPPQWLKQPKRGMTRTRERSLTVSVTAMGNGQEVYRTSATQRYRRHASTDLEQGLAKAVCTSISTSWAAAEKASLPNGLNR